MDYGETVFDDLGKLLADSSALAANRRQIPRVLSQVPLQGSVEILERSLSVRDLSIRGAVLKALNRLRSSSPHLDYSEELATKQIRSEALFYYQLFAALQQFRQAHRGGKATALLTRTLEERLKETIDRLFRLLGLRYPPKQIYAAYLAFSHQRSEDFSSALEFLDALLDHDLKSVLLPMIDGSPHLLDIGREVFGVEVPDMETALRQQIHSGDGWLSVCAIATAAELELRSLRPDISRAADTGGPEKTQVARQAMAALA